MIASISVEGPVAFAEEGRFINSFDRPVLFEAGEWLREQLGTDPLPANKNDTTDTQSFRTVRPDGTYQEHVMERSVNDFGKWGTVTATSHETLSGSDTSFSGRLDSGRNAKMDRDRTLVFSPPNSRLGVGIAGGTVGPSLSLFPGGGLISNGNKTILNINAPFGEGWWANVKYDLQNNRGKAGVFGALFGGVVGLEGRNGNDGTSFYLGFSKTF